MLASGWRMGKLMSLFDILGLTVWERKMSEARFWPDGYVSKVYTYSTGMKLWTNTTLGLVDEALTELWCKLILSLEIHGPFSIEVGATTTSPLVMITVQCIAFWDSVSSKVLARKKRKPLKSWRPNLDENGEATEYKTLLVASVSTIQQFTFNIVEAALLQTALKTGTCTAKGRKFAPSAQLKQLRANRRTTQDAGIRRILTFQIHRLHRMEVRKWKSRNLAQHLHNPSQWNSLRGMPLRTRSRTMSQPPVHDFANMLETLFAGNPSGPQQPGVLTEPGWSPDELAKAIQKLKLDRAVDECGLAAELLKHLPDVFLQKLLALYNHVLCSGEVPSSWRRTVFTMLGKHVKPKLVSDYRTIASVRVLYKTFAYMILGRIEHCLENSQPEEQHGFRSGRRLEEHLVTANLVGDKFFAANRPLWIASLDLSKAFDRINSDALWQSLLEHGVSAHMVWILQLLYFEQTGEVKGTWGNSTVFPIKAGVRQGCVLSPRLFCSVLQWAMKDWRAWAESNGWGIDFHDGYPPLLDLRFADDILIFSDTAEGVALLLDALITTLDKTGLKLNASKTVILTTEAQPPDHITTPAGHTIVVKDSFGTHKWLGCMLSALGSGNVDADITYHLQAAARAFHSNKWIFLDKNISINSKLKFFEATVTPIACFAAGHRSIRQRDLHILDVEFRRLVRSVVGPPFGVCWSSPWHEILHEWNARVQQILQHTHHKSWGQTALCHHWKLASYIANLPPNRWAKRALEWQPRARRAGRRPNTWLTKIEEFARWQRWDNWQDVAVRNPALWEQSMPEFVQFAVGR